MSNPLAFLEKVLAMGVAARLTEAAVGPPPAGLPVDPQLQSPDVRSRNLQVWETFRVFYRGVVGALPGDDPKVGWPAPALGLDPASLGSVLSTALPAALSAAA